MEFSFDREFATARVLVILRGLGPTESLSLARRAWDAGVRSIEVPIQHPDDLAALEVLADEAGRRGLVVGAGTVIRPEQVDLARRHGAVYTVSPGVDEEVIRTSLDAGLPTLPGVATASDIQRCRRIGLEWLKVFPAASLGPQWMRSMLGPFPEAKFVATGGITIATAGDYLTAGARVVALGSALTADPTAASSLANLLRAT